MENKNQISDEILANRISDEFLAELKQRRKQLFSQMPVSSIAVLPGSSIQFRSGDTEYPFRQNSDFYYLTGFCEADALVILTKSESGQESTILFCQASDPAVEVWTGPRIGLKGAQAFFGADQSFDITALNEKMPSFIENRKHMVYTLGLDRDFDKKMMAWIRENRAKNRKGISSPEVWMDLKSLIDKMRLKKNPYEIELMQKAASISAQGHLKLMQSAKPGISEYHLEAEFLHYCYSQGARAMAYNPIVGGGENACVLHYNANDRVLKEGDLVLVDAGCEYQYYAADITRTFPVSGRFSEKQAAIYNLVLKAQVEAIEMIRPGLAWDAMQDRIVNIITSGLLDLGLLRGKMEVLLDQKAYQRFYMHSSGHWLGLDVHDVGGYKRDGKWISLEPGMVLTVEPGIYIPSNQKDIDKSWWGIGVRIEDDVLVTERGFEVLSREVPKTIEEIEGLMARSNKHSII